MNNSRKFVASSSENIPEENHEEPKPSAGTLPHQPHLPSPTSFSFPSLMQTAQTFPAAMSHGGAQYWFNSDGYLNSNCLSMNDMSKPFRMKPFILEIPNGIDIINCVMQLAQRYRLSVTVLTGHGLISQVDVVYPRDAILPQCVSACYGIVSFSGTYSCLNAASGDIVSCFNVLFADAGGNVMGGRIVSTMKAASNVTLVVTISNYL